MAIKDNETSTGHTLAIDQQEALTQQVRLRTKSLLKETTIKLGPVFQNENYWINENRDH